MFKGSLKARWNEHGPLFSPKYPEKRPKPFYAGFNNFY